MIGSDGRAKVESDGSGEASYRCWFLFQYTDAQMSCPRICAFSMCRSRPSMLLCARSISFSVSVRSAAMYVKWYARLLVPTGIRSPR